MNKRLKYSGTDKMSDLICENYNLLLVMSRFRGCIRVLFWLL